MPKPKYCWDACLFIAHLMNEERAEDETAGMREVLQAVSAGRALIITSAVVLTEVLNRPGDGQNARDKLNVMVTRPGFTLIDPNMVIANKAAEFRERVAASGNNQLKRNDAIYLATASIYEVKELHTFDTVLLGLDGSPLVEGLRIVKPRGDQTSLAL